jgi:uncharacterized protein
MLDNTAWIETFTGRRFYVLDPRAMDVDVDDIAHALSMLCRFTGHVREFYSVAEHSVRVSRLCDPADALWGLLHDSSEAYLADMNSPLKRTPEMSRYRTAERHVMAAVIERFGLGPHEPPSVKTADRRLLVTEKRDLMPPSPPWEDFASFEPLAEKIVPWSAKDAERAFLRRFDELTRVAVPQADGWSDGGCA